MNTNTRTAFTRVGAGAGTIALCAALTLGAASSASATGLAPVAASDSYAVTAGSTIAVSSASGVLANDTDAEGDPLLVGTGALAPAGGQLPGESMGLWSDGHFFYTPPTDFTGTRTFTYNAFDGSGTSNWASIVFSITAAPPASNAAPVSVSDGYAVTQDVVYSLGAPGILANDSDPDGDALEVAGHTQPAGGQLPGEALSLDKDGLFHYVPPIGFTGVRTWTYTATDGTDVSAPADITFTITAPAAPGNSVPVANAEAYLLNADATMSKPAADGILANDTDADGDTLHVGTVWSPAGGALPGEALVITNQDGAFSYTPPTGYMGDRVYTYTVTDGTDTSNVTTLTFNIAGAAPANTAPVANPDSYAVITNVPVSPAAPGLLVNDTDADGDTLELDSATPPAGGLLPGENLVGSPDGSFTYTPPTDFAGTRVFTYQIYDGTVFSNSTTLTFHVTSGAPTNAAPVAVADSYLVVKDVLFARSAPGIFANDSDADGDALGVVNATNPAGGMLPGEKLTGNPDGSFEYTPPTGFTGDRVFGYTLTDGTTTSAPTTITFTVKPRVALDEPTIPTLPDGDPDDSTIPTGLASTGATPSYALGVLAAMLAATGFVLVRSSRRVA